MDSYNSSSIIYQGGEVVRESPFTKEGDDNTDKELKVWKYKKRTYASNPSTTSRIWHKVNFIVGQNSEFSFS